MPLFDLLPFWAFVVLALLGVLAGFGLRVLIRDIGLRQEGATQSRQERFEEIISLFSQSAAIGLALTLVADLLLAARTSDTRLLAGLTVLIAALTSFGAAFLREVIRRLFYKDP